MAAPLPLLIAERQVDPLSELLGQSDEDAFRSADVTEPILILVLHHLTNELGTTSAQAGNDILDVVNGEHDATYSERVRGCVLRFTADRGRPLELHQLKPAVSVRGPHHCEIRSDVLQPDEAVHHRPLDCRLAVQLETKLDEESDSSREVVDNNANVVHPPNRHVPSIGRDTLDQQGSTESPNSQEKESVARVL
jgi:hypothetical protein